MSSDVFMGHVDIFSYIWKLRNVFLIIGLKVYLLDDVCFGIFIGDPYFIAFFYRFLFVLRRDLIFINNTVQKET
jgi:hypothetical protein